MFYSLFLVLFIVLFVVWVLGWFAFHVAGGLIHLLLLVAVILLFGPGTQAGDRQLAFLGSAIASVLDIPGRPPGPQAILNGLLPMGVREARTPF